MMEPNIEKRIENLERAVAKIVCVVENHHKALNEQIDAIRQLTDGINKSLERIDHMEKPNLDYIISEDDEDDND